MMHGQFVVGYHGCDITTRDRLVTGREKPLVSGNPYDWLGKGFYLFEGDAERARAFANTAAAKPKLKLTKVPIHTPAVVGCLLSAYSWLDMTTWKGKAEYRASLDQIAAATGGKNRPVNKAAFEGDADILLRGLDRAVINNIHSGGPTKYQVVRGAFRQGDELSPLSGFHSHSHIQLAVYDLNCIVGWFLLPNDKLLTENEYDDALAKLAAIKSAAV